MCGEHPQCTDHTGLPQLTAAMLSGSTLIRLQGTVHSGPAFHARPRSEPLRFGSQVLRKGTDPVGVQFVPFPGLSSSDRVLGERTVPGRPRVLTTSPVRAAWFPGCAARAPSQVRRVSPLGSCDIGPRPFWQMSTSQDPRKTWSAAESLLTVWGRVLVSGLWS